MILRHCICHYLSSCTFPYLFIHPLTRSLSAFIMHTVCSYQVFAKKLLSFAPISYNDYTPRLGSVVFRNVHHVSQNDITRKFLNPDNEFQVILPSYCNRYAQQRLN